MSKHILTPVNAIREYCKDCSAGSLKEIRLCNQVDCPLFPYRMGRRPTENEIKTIEQSLKENGTKKALSY